MDKHTRGRRPRPGVCVYCGQDTIVEDDHLFPRCLWPKQMRHGVKFIRVPACRDCNRDKSGYDDALRDRIDLDPTSSDRVDHKEQVTIIKRSTDHGSSVIGKSAQAVLDELRDQPDVSWPINIPVEPEPFLSAVRYIIRGLYYIHTDQVLPPDEAIADSKFLSLSDTEKRAPYFAAFAQYGGLMGNVCSWQAVFPSSDPFSSLWLLRFKDGVFFMGMTQRLSIEGDQPAS